MLSLRITNATRVIAKDQPEFNELSIRDIPQADGSNVMVSLWELTPKEIEYINSGEGQVVLEILGKSFPPVKLSVRPNERTMI